VGTEDHVRMSEDLPACGQLLTGTPDIHCWGYLSRNSKLTVSTAFYSPLIMSDNPSFVLRGIEDVFYEDRPIPSSASPTRLRVLLC